MAKYTVRIEEVNSAEIVVEADSEQEAIDAAYEEIESGNEFLTYKSDDVNAWIIEDDEE
jgi:hypothetical protein